MKNVLWDGNYSTLKELFPIENAAHAIMLDRETKELTLIPVEGETFTVKVGEYVIKNDDGSVTKMVELHTSETIAT